MMIIVYLILIRNHDSKADSCMDLPFRTDGWIELIETGVPLEMTEASCDIVFDDC
jgi:hypothetical protein